ncbi:MAG: addiction module protein [Planctomycetes bacterium]|nr:addiction module protein [Planctomycetota bacterium]
MYNPVIMSKEHPVERAAPGISAEGLFAQAVHLKPRDRAALAGRLLASVNRDAGRDQKAAFHATVLQRFAELESGTEKGHTVEQSLAAMRRRPRRKS